MRSRFRTEYFYCLTIVLASQAGILKFKNLKNKLYNCNLYIYFNPFTTNIPYKGCSASSLNLLNDPYRSRHQRVEFGTIFCTPSLCTVKYLCMVSSQKVRVLLSWTPSKSQHLERTQCNCNLCCWLIAFLKYYIYVCPGAGVLVWVEHQEWALKQALTDDLKGFQWSSVIVYFSTSNTQKLDISA
jgi:hypothetical protein